MDWLNVSSIEELKKLGKFTEIKKKISQEFGGSIKVSARSWDNLFTMIMELKLFLVKRTNLNKIDIDRNSNNSVSSNLRVVNYTYNRIKNIEYFKTEVDQYIYYLLELDGKVRQKKLNITDYHYRNNQYASKWYKDIIKIIDPDICKHEKANQAVAELNNIYKGMTSIEEERNTTYTSS
ncbi:hypothetical protein SLL00_04890 [Metabacillus indicus]|uniref:hypothetical protein n=1 Tax=Metabacillus indicus TaxID=246786 RepID=UPI002A03ED21|nr:hypothetical protein [Metabacillus indicus]MDX8289113.1 hypothetical protein [Metabacillus indicus]